jgi:hypothetical protein
VPVRQAEHEILEPLRSDSAADDPDEPLRILARVAKIMQRRTERVPLAMAVDGNEGGF